MQLAFLHLRGGTDGGPYRRGGVRLSGKIAGLGQPESAGLRRWPVGCTVTEDAVCSPAGETNQGKCRGGAGAGMRMLFQALRHRGGITQF